MLQYCLETDTVFTWRLRLQIELALHNLTRNHLAIITLVADMAEAGHCQVTHAELAAATHCHRRTVGEALRRAAALGLLHWRRSYRTAADGLLRRREANIYERTMPNGPAIARPDVRPRYGGKIAPAKKGVSFRKVEALERRGGPVLPSLAAIARLREAEFARRWQGNRRDSGRRDSG
jgi:hypothetical protein